MRNLKWTDEQLIAAVANSTSVAQVVSNLGLKIAGGNYTSIRDAISSRKIDMSHFTGQAWSKGKTIGYKKSVHDYLSRKTQVSSHYLRLRLISSGIKEARCEKCNLMEWQGLPISLELDHIDGNPQNNSLDNLAVLCPNCHAQTPTYRSKNITRTAKK